MLCTDELLEVSRLRAFGDGKTMDCVSVPKARSLAMSSWTHTHALAVLSFSCPWD